MSKTFILKRIQPLLFQIELLAFFIGLFINLKRNFESHYVSICGSQLIIEVVFFQGGDS